MTRLRDLVLSYGGDWRHPGVYSVIHHPTGLEYVGGSACVLQRIRKHFAGATKSKPHGPFTWVPKLKVALSFIKHGPYTARTRGGDVAISSLEDVRHLPTISCWNVVESNTQRGLDVQIRLDDLCPVWRRTCPLDYEGIRQAEEEEYNYRRPFLNAQRFGGYVGPYERSGYEQLELGPSPVPMPDGLIKALPIILKLRELNEADKRSWFALRGAQRGLESQLRAKAMADSREVYTQRLTELVAECPKNMRDVAEYDNPGLYALCSAFTNTTTENTND